MTYQSSKPKPHSKEFKDAFDQIATGAAIDDSPVVRLDPKSGHFVDVVTGQRAPGFA